MNRSGWLWLGLFLAVAPQAYAQRPQRPLSPPHIGYVYPAGGQQGTTFEVIVGGQYLEDVSKVFITGDGVKVVVGKFDRPLTTPEVNKLRDKLEEAQKRLGLDKKEGGLGRGGPILTVYCS
jgi:hypothetical protein